MSPRLAQPNPSLWVDGLYVGATPLPKGREVMPMTDFSDEKRQEIGDAVLGARRPPMWLDLGLAMIVSRAWAEWHWARVIDVGIPLYRPHIPVALRRSVYERDGHLCVTCSSPDDLTLDHIHPFSLGGPDSFENLQTMCRPCNSRKGARV